MNSIVDGNADHNNSILTYHCGTMETTVRELKPYHTVKIKTINILRDSAPDYQGKELITNPKQIASIVRGLLRDLEDVEHFFVFPMNQQNRILGVHIVTKGTVNSVDIRPRETFRSAIMMNATSIILAHNHPSGNLDPSREDIAITKQLVEAGRVVDIRVLDHVIATLWDDAYTSLSERGLM